jgi:hypothetical protein
MPKVFDAIFFSAYACGIGMTSISSCFISDWRIYVIAILGCIWGGLAGYKSYTDRSQPDNPDL